MVVYRKILLFSLAFVSLFCACSKSGSDNKGDSTEKDSAVVYKFSEPQYVFGFAGQKRYSYCPSALLQDDGSVQMFFCGNPNQGVMVDNVYHIQILPTGFKTDPVSVLQPSLSWDSHHTCDPDVIEGDFKMDGINYKYAMFYLSNPLSLYYNEVGVAFSNDLNSVSWTKYPKQLVEKTWPGEVDQSLGGNYKSWGVGQPSAVSLDKKGKVLLTYTIGDASGTRVAETELDLSDMSDVKVLSPSKEISKTGLLNVNGDQDITCDCDFAINLDKNIILMVRPVQPTPSTYPAYIPAIQEIDYMPLDQFRSGGGQWTAMGSINSVVSNFPRNHNACILRDNFGHISDWENPTVFYTVSKEYPAVDASTGNHAEWTYHIYRTTLTKHYRYFQKGGSN